MSVPTSCRRFLASLAAFALCATLQAEDSAATPQSHTLDTTDAVILGVVEGITEYLPISSTGHLIIANHLLVLDGEEPLADTVGNIVHFKTPTPENPDGIPLTNKLAADTFAIVIQFGAIAAVALLYWRQLVAMFLGLFGRNPAGLRLLVNLLVAFTPAALVGFFTHDLIEKYLFSVPTVIAALLVGALAMIYAEHWRKKNSGNLNNNDKLPPQNTLETLAPKQALTIGILQCAALWPGMSRSMTTIVGGYFVRLNPKQSAEFSFLLGLVTLSAATAYKTLQSGAAMVQVFGTVDIVIGCIVAAITAALAVRFLVNYLTRHGLLAFAIYRILLAAILGAWLIFG